MSALLVMLVFAQTDGGCLRDRDGRIVAGGMGLSSVKRINDALALGACEQAQRELVEAVRCDSSPKRSMEPFLERIELCRSRATDAGTR